MEKDSKTTTYVIKEEKKMLFILAEKSNDYKATIV